MAGAPIDNRGEAMYRLGLIYRLHDPDSNVISINTEKANRDSVVIRRYDIVRMCEYNEYVNIAGDSVTQAIRDVIDKIEGRD